MRHLAAIACLLLVACAPKAPPPPPNYRPQIQVAETPPPQPFVDVLRHASHQADALAAASQARAETVAREAGTLRTGLAAATAEADKLRKQKTANEKELQALWSMLTMENARAEALFAEVEKQRTAAQQERELRVLAGKALDDLQNNINSLMSERAMLRLQIADAEAGSKAAHTSAADHHAAAAKAKAAADKAKGAIAVWRQIALSAIASTIILIAFFVIKQRLLL